MALNLNKEDENNSKPSTEKKGLNLSKSDNSGKENLNLNNDRPSSGDYSSSPNTQTNAKKKSPVLFIMAAVVFVGLGVFWFMNNQTTPTPPPIPPTPNNDKRTDKGSTPPPDTPIQLGGPEKPKEPTPGLSGTIEEKAKVVISGSFGNGAERKKALGDEYAEIQAKINEIYRNKPE